MKVLLYCTKGKPYLTIDEGFRQGKYYEEYATLFNYSKKDAIDIFDEDELYNGKIVAECDYEVSEIELHPAFYNYGPAYFTKRKEPFRYFSYTDLLEASCLQDNEMLKYLGNNDGKAINIENLHIFDEPRELSDYYKKLSSKEYDAKINKLGYRPKEWLNVPVSINKHFAIQSILEPLKKAPQNMIYVYEYDESISNEVYYKKSILVPVHPDILCKILNGECTIIIKKKVLKEMIK